MFRKTSGKMEEKNNFPEKPTISQHQMHGESEDWKTNGGWLKYIYTADDKTLLSLLKAHPELLCKTIEISCFSPFSQTNCTCCNQFESLSFINLDFEGLYRLACRGYCSHILVTLICMAKGQNTSRSTQAFFKDHSALPHVTQNLDKICESFTEDYQFTEVCDDISAPGPYRKLRLKRYQEDHRTFSLLELIRKSDHSQLFTEESDIVQASVTVVHVLAALGKAELLKKVIDFVLKSDKDLWMNCQNTRVLMFLPLHHAVVHEHANVAELLIKYGKTLNIAPSQQLHSVMISASKNNVQLLKICLKDWTSWRKECLKFSALATAVRFSCRDVLKYVIHKGANFTHRYHCVSFAKICATSGMDSKDDWEHLVLNNNIQTASQILKIDQVDLGALLHYPVYCDNVEIVKLILEKAKKLKSRIRDRHRIIPYLIQATLNNSPAMIELFLSVNVCSAFEEKDGYSARTWAKVLQFTDCAELLEKASIPVNEDQISNFPPLVAVFSQGIESYKFRKRELIDRLKENGYSLHCESAKGITPLTMALQNNEQNVHVPRLLKEGLDPFQGTNCLRSHTSCRFLHDLLYANVNIFPKRNDFSLIRHIVHICTSLQTELGFLLRHAHTVPQDDKNFLSSVHVHCLPESVQDDINEFLTFPKTLQELSRDSLRGYYGIRIESFLEAHVPKLPDAIKSIIMIRKELHDYRMKNNSYPTQNTVVERNRKFHVNLENHNQMNLPFCRCCRMLSLEYGLS